MAQGYQSEAETLAGAGYPNYAVVGRAPITETKDGPRDKNGDPTKITTKVGERWSLRDPSGKRAEIAVTVIPEPNSPSGNVYAVLDAGSKDTPAAAGSGANAISQAGILWQADPNDATRELGYLAYDDGTVKPLLIGGVQASQAKAAGGSQTATPASSILYAPIPDKPGFEQGYVIIGGKRQDIDGVQRPIEVKEGPKVAPDRGGFDWFPDQADPSREIYGRMVDGVFQPSTTPDGGQMVRPKTPKVAVAGPSSTIYVPVEGDPTTEKGVRVILDENGKEIGREDTGEIRKKANALLGTDPSSPFTYAVDAQGNEVPGSRRDNPNYKAPVGTQLATNTEAPYIQILKPDGTIESAPNTNRLTVDEATSEFMQSVGLQVKAGSMSMAQAKDLLTQAINKMNADTSRITANAAQQNADTSLQESIRSAASNVLDYTQKNAQTGANLLQQRTQTAGSLLNQILQFPGQGAQSTAGRFGQIGGGLHGDVSGLYSGVLGGIEGWTASLMGGQDTLDAAASFIKQANPNTDMTSPQAQAALGTLSQIYDRYQQISGAPHPDVAAQAAAKQTVGAGAVTAPVTNAVAGTVPNSLGGQQPQDATQGQGVRPYVQSGQIFPQPQRNRIGGMQSPITINIGGGMQ
jgi:hypothetical protein